MASSGGGVTRREKRRGVRPDAGDAWEPVGRREEVRAVCPGGCFLESDWQCLLRGGSGASPVLTAPVAPRGPLDRHRVDFSCFPTGPFTP